MVKPKSASIGWVGFFSGSAGAFAGTDSAGFGAISGICRCENLGGLNRILPIFILHLWIKLGRGLSHSIVSLSRPLRGDRFCNTLRTASSKRTIPANQSKGVKRGSFWGKAWHSWHTSSFLALASEEVIKQFARLLKLSCVCLVANCEDGIRRQLSAFRCRLRCCMEEIQERITHRPDFGQHHFGGISGPLSRSAQSGPAQPLGESLSRAFGGSFYLS